LRPDEALVVALLGRVVLLEVGLSLTVGLLLAVGLPVVVVVIEGLALLADLTEGEPVRPLPLLS